MSREERIAFWTERYRRANYELLMQARMLHDSVLSENEEAIQKAVFGVASAYVVRSTAAQEVYEAMSERKLPT